MTESEAKFIAVIIGCLITLALAVVFTAYRFPDWSYLILIAGNVAMLIGSFIGE
jgi:uncharacterized membrane protein YjjP (DUF1212 family)